MTLRLRFDHRLDRLADALILQLAEPPAHPLAEDVVIVPGLGVGRWLQQRVAARLGVCARLRLEFAGRFLWQASVAMMPQLPARSPFDPATARWSVMQLLESLPDAPELAPLARRVARASPADRLALAGEIAAQFERYLAWRRDWLAHWQAGRRAAGAQPLGVHELWQRWLWRALLERLPAVGARHPFDLLAELLEREPDQARHRLGQGRIAVLGAVGLSPDQLELLVRLAAVTELSIFAPDPCRELWSDMLDRASLARVQAQRPDVAWLYDSEPSVLGDWGRAQRDLVAQLLALEERAGIQAEAPFRDEAGDAPAGPLTRLQALQTAVLERSDRCWSRLAPGADDSLQLHSTHGPFRQAEVLHDCLLECFESMPGLRPADVAVFCADVEELGAAIEAVFGSIGGARRIPVAVSGRRATADPLIGAALELLAIAEAGMRLSALCAWLDVPVVGEALGLDAQETGDLVRWLDASGARWGLDAADGPARHHWQAAIDRLLLGAAVGGEQDEVAGIAPVAGAQAIAAQLARLLPALDVLARFRELGREPRPVADWCAAAQDAFTALFGSVHRGSDAFGSLLDALGELRAGAAGEPQLRIDAAGFRRALGEQLDQGASAAVASGAVTVCPLGGLRGVPFRVVCLAGMDETAFPRRAAHSEIDLMLRAPRFGDRVARIDDRGAFLDALLAAGERVLILYQGRDPRDDSVRNPSTVVGELQAYVNAREAAHGKSMQAVGHPLHPFSPRAFAGPRPGYAVEWEATARALAAPMAQRPEAAGPLVEVEPPSAAAAGAAVDAGPEGMELGFDDLRRALSEPAQTWLQHALGLRLPADAQTIDDEEPLWEDAYRDRPLVGVAARRLLAGADPGRVRAALAASPATAAGGAGRLQVDALMATAEALVERALEVGGGQAAAAAAAREPRPAVSLRLALPVPGAGTLRVAAMLDGLGSDLRQLRVSPYPLGASAVIEAWLAHALWIAGGAGGHPGSSDEPGAAQPLTRLVARDGVVELRGPAAAGRLPQVLAWALRIRAEPLPLFPRSFFSYRIEGGDPRAARRAMFGDDRSAGEVERPWVRALYRDAPPALEPVLEVSELVYGPVFDDCAIHRDSGRGR